MTKPPFELNEKILNLVAEISNKITRLEFKIDTKKDLYLRKVSKIKSVNSSCAIEANTLSMEEVASIINGKIVLAPLNEIKEVKNAYDAYTNIDIFDQYSVESFLSAHKLLTEGLIKDSGRFRVGDVGVFDGKKVIHMGARPNFVPKLINELFDWAEASQLHPLIKSSIVHFEIEFSHPFGDGNGRIGRLWQSLILYKYNRVFEYVPIETLIYENQQQYYDTLALCEKEGSSTMFIEFMLDMILQTIEKFDATDNTSLIPSKFINHLSRTELTLLVKLLEYYETSESINIGIAVKLLEKNEANIRKYFRKFSDLNIITPIGEKKGRRYILNKESMK